MERERNISFIDNHIYKSDIDSISNNLFDSLKTIDTTIISQSDCTDAVSNWIYENKDM